MSKAARIQKVEGVSQVIRGNSVRLRWRYAGNGAQQSTTVPTIAEAYTAALKIKAEGWRVFGKADDVRNGSLWKGNLDLPRHVAPVTFEDVAERILATRVRLGQTTERTANGHRSRVRRMPWRRSLVGAVTMDEVNEWLTSERRRMIAREGRSPKPALAAGTANQYRMTVAMVLNDAARRGERAHVDNLTREIVKARSSARTDWLTEGQLADVVDACAEPLFADMFLILGYMGFRIGEALFLNVSDVDVRRRVVDVRGTIVGSKSRGGWSTGKTENTPRPVAILDDDTLAAFVRVIGGRRGDVPLFAWPEGSPAHSKIGNRVGTRPSDHVCRERFKAACVEVGLKPLGLHALRHSHVTWLINDGAGFLAVATRIGDTVGEVARTYAHLDPNGVDAMRASLRKRAANARAERQAARPLHSVA
jgi:integrase